MFNTEKIEKRLTKSFVMVSAISAIAAIAGLIAVIVISNRYSYALKNFGFAQGDIGKTLFTFADSRSSLRAAIGYDDADAIATVVEQHAQNKTQFQEYFAQVEHTIVSEDGRKTYDEIEALLDEYWALDQEIMDLGATTDRELCKQAQDLALNELAGKYNSAVNALPALSKEPVDLLFLDIQMPELNGMEFSRILKTDTRIIFTTAFSQYALDSYKVNSLDYLLKPISYADFLKSANKALQWYELLREGSGKSTPQTPALPIPPSVESIFIKTEYKLVQVELRKILYIEGLKDYVKIFVEGEAHPILSLMSMKSLEDMLPANRFIRVHRSFIVQPEKIKVIERNRIVFGKEYIPISDNYKQKFMEFLAQRALLP